MMIIKMAFFFVLWIKKNFCLYPMHVHMNFYLSLFSNFRGGVENFISYKTKTKFLLLHVYKYIGAHYIMNERMRLENIFFLHICVRAHKIRSWKANQTVTSSCCRKLFAHVNDALDYKFFFIISILLEYKIIHFSKQKLCWFRRK